MFPEGLVTTDAPVDPGVDETTVDTGDLTDTGTETTEQTDTGVEPKGTPGEKPEGTPPANVRPVVDGKLSPEFKPFYDKLKAEQPALARAVMNAIQMESRFLKEVPGGLKEVQQLREHIERLGGEDGIQELTGELDGWRGFDEQYTAGDPKILEFLTETPEASAAFLKIAPSAFEKFRELHPEGYGAYVSQVFLGDMQQSKIPEQLIELRYIVGGMPDGDLKTAAVAVLGKLNGYLERIGTLASKQVTPPAAKAPGADDKRASELTQRETNLRRTEWRGETDKTHRNLFNSEFKKQIGDRKLSDSQRATVLELYGLKLGAILKGLPKFNENLEKYFASNQRDGFVRYIESAYKDAVPRALRAAIGQAGIGAKPGPAAGALPKQGTGAIKPAAGFTFVTAKPAMSLVNNRETTPDMWLKGQAVLKDGKRVTWKV